MDFPLALSALLQLNKDGTDFGCRSGGQRVGDVALPPWAADAADFLYKLQEALESPLVSARLHKWVDLVFGRKSRGAAAEKADNVFHYLTYDDVARRFLEQEGDPALRDALRLQMMEFGRTPRQVRGALGLAGGAGLSWAYWLCMTAERTLSALISSVSNLPGLPVLPSPPLQLFTRKHPKRRVLGRGGALACFRCFAPQSAAVAPRPPTNLLTGKPFDARSIPPVSRAVFKLSCSPKADKREALLLFLEQAAASGEPDALALRQTKGAELFLLVKAARDAREGRTAVAPAPEMLSNLVRAVAALATCPQNRRYILEAGCLDAVGEALAAPEPELAATAAQVGAPQGSSSGSSRAGCIAVHVLQSVAVQQTTNGPPHSAHALSVYVLPCRRRWRCWHRKRARGCRPWTAACWGTCWACCATRPAQRRSWRPCWPSPSWQRPIRHTGGWLYCAALAASATLRPNPSCHRPLAPLAALHSKLVLLPLPPCRTFFARHDLLGLLQEQLHSASQRAASAGSPELQESPTAPRPDSRAGLLQGQRAEALAVRRRSTMHRGAPGPADTQPALLRRQQLLAMAVVLQDDAQKEAFLASPAALTALLADCNSSSMAVRGAAFDCVASLTAHDSMRQRVKVGGIQGCRLPTLPAVFVSSSHPCLPNSSVLLPSPSVFCRSCTCCRCCWRVRPAAARWCSSRRPPASPTCVLTRGCCWRSWVRSRGWLQWWRWRLRQTARCSGTLPRRCGTWQCSRRRGGRPWRLAP